MDHRTSSTAASPRRLYLIALLGLGVVGCGDQTGPELPQVPLTPMAGGQGPALQDRYIVVFDRSVPDVDAAIEQLRPALGIADVQYRYRHVLQGFAATLPAQAVEALRRHPQVALVEPDAEIQATTLTAQAGATWGLDRVDQRTRPLDGTYTYGADGAGVTAYIINTGILTSHTEFGGRAAVGYDAFGGTGIDCNGHGTHVAGTVGGTTWGIAKGVNLVAVRVLDCSGSGTTSSVIAGLDWVAANARRPAVANMSLGGGASTSLDNAVATAVQSGVTMVVAAGNSNANACNYSPARATSAITVGATASDDSRASYSNYGSCLDLFAPGSSITSAWHTGPSVANTISGTSMAAPHAAGVAALLLQVTPTATVSAVTTALLNATTTSVVTGAGTGSPNRLLSNIGISVTPVSPPVAPASLNATVISSSRIDLAWEDVTGEDRYEVERSTDGVTFTYVGATGVGGTTLAATGLAGSTTYQFRVRAVNAGGPSDYSPVASATTAAAPSAMFVSALAGNNSVVNKAAWRATATVAVSDAMGPVAGAVVSGAFSAGGSGTCTTTTSGTCTITSANISTKTSSTRFSVSTVSHGTIPYDATKNAISSVSITRP